MIVRRAEDKDVNRILELLVQVNNVHNDGRPDLFLRDRTKYTKEELIEIIHNDQSPVFVAVDQNDHVLGYSFGVFQSHIKDNNFPDIVTYYIDDICVDEKTRHQHVGKTLFEYTADYARDAGCYNITLNVWEKNDSAKKFYENIGFHVQKTGLEIIL